MIQQDRKGEQIKYLVINLCDSLRKAKETLIKHSLDAYSVSGTVLGSRDGMDAEAFKDHTFSYRHRQYTHTHITTNTRKPSGLH